LIGEEEEETRVNKFTEKPWRINSQKNPGE
jgi:hypothetical protein